MTQKTGKTHVQRPINPASGKQSPSNKRLIQEEHKKTNRFSQLTESKLYILLSLALFVLFVVYQTLVTNRPVIWKLHDQSLFLTDLTYLKECLSSVGGLSVYIASFFNDFFLTPWLGTIFYTTFLLLVIWVTSKAFNLKGWLFPLALIPSLLLLLSLTQNGYMIYVIKLKAFSYVGILGILVTLTGALLGAKARKPIVQSLVAVLYMLVAYPVAGVYGVMGTLLFAIFSLKHGLREKQYVHLIPAGVALLALFMVPRAYDWVYQATLQEKLYLANLPDYWHTESERFLWLPYKLLAGCLLLLALLPKKMPSMNSVVRLLPFVLFIAVVFFVDKKTFKDENFKTELRMMEASEKGDWNQVLQLANEVKDEPTRLIVMHTNLALFKLGKLGDALYHYRDGNKIKKAPRGIFDVYLAGPFFYFQYGKINYSYKWCMENTVEYGQSPTSLNYFVLSCAVNGQKKLAEKYNNILSKSLLYRSLSKKLAKIIEDPTLLEKEPAYSKVLVLTKFDNFLDCDQSEMERYLRFNFAFKVGGPPEMVELCLLANMDLRNPNQFWPAYFYYIQNFKRPIPIHIQEAALLFNHLQKTNYIDPSRFDPTVLKRFDQFLAMIQQYAGMADYTVKDLFKAPFGDTYWYQFSFITNHSNPSNSPKYSPYSS